MTSDRISGGSAMVAGEGAGETSASQTLAASRSALAGRPVSWASGCLVLILLTAFLMRAPSIAHDLPFLYTHDEVSTVETALRFGGGSLNPYSYGHGPLMAYLTAGLYGVYYGALKLSGTVSGAEDFILGYLEDPTPFYVIQRGFAVALTLGLIVMVYLIGKRLAGIPAGLIAALLVAYANLVFVLSLAGREDMLYLFLLMVGVYVSLDLHEGRGSSRRWLGAGVVFGLATAAKYFSIFGMLVPLLGLQGADRKVRSAELLGLGYGVGVLLGMPFALLDFPDFAASIGKLASQTSGGPQTISLVDGLAYPTVHLYNSIGLPFYVLSLASAVFLLVTARRLAALLLIPCLVFLAFLVSRPGNQGHYYVAFVVPFLCLAVGTALARAVSWFGPWRWAPVLALVGLLLWPNVIADLRYTQYLAMPDTREASKRWIEQNVASGSSVLVETHATDFGIREGPALRETAKTLELEAESIRNHGGSGKFWQYKVTSARRDRTGPRYDLIKIGTVTPQSILMTSADFVVMSLVPDSNVDAYRVLSGRARLLRQYVSAANFRGDLLISMEELATLPSGSSGGDLPTRGPTISIWQRRASLLSSSGA